MEEKFTINEQGVIDFFLTNPSALVSARQLARKLRITHPTVLGVLQKIHKFEIVKKEAYGAAFLWKANTEGAKYMLFKKISNLEKISLSRLIEKIASKTSPNAIVLFGSYSRGEDTEESDIDIFVQSREKSIELKIYEKKLQRKINITFEPAIQNLSKEFLNNLINGIVLYGYLEVLT